jgi:iron complex outermembrane recepter protein
MPHSLFKHSPKMRRLLLLVLAICAPHVGAATPHDFMEMSLEELVDYRLMSMSRKEQRVADMAAAAVVISQEEIRRSGAQSIPEALRLVPGLNVAQISSDRWAVGSRGFNERLSNKLLIQVDGRSVYSPIFSGVLWEAQDIVMEDIERIEVIRGPGAALWGTNAMNGVINIVTRSAALSQGNLVSAGVDSVGGHFASFIHAGQLAQGGHYKLTGKVGRTGGSPERSSGLTGPDAAQNQRLGIRIEPHTQTGSLMIKAEIYINRSNDVWGFPSLPAFSDPPNAYTREALLAQSLRGAFIQARYKWKGQEGHDNALQVSLDQDRTSNIGLWGTGTGAVGPLATMPQKASHGGAKTELDVDFQQRRNFALNDVIWGLNLRHIADNLEMPNSPYVLAEGRNKRTNYSAFVQNEFTMVPDRWKLIVGSKFERDGLTGGNIQPNVRTLFTPNANEAFWSALSQSARSLRRFETYSKVDVLAQDAQLFNPAIPPQFLTAVTQLSPLTGAQPVAEKALSLEAGWRKQFSNFFSLDGAVFVTDYSRLRGARLLPNPVAGLMMPGVQECPYINGPGVCYFTVDGFNSNADTARSKGGELSLEWHPKPWWKLQTHYSYLDVKGQRSGDVLGDLLMSMIEQSSPKHQFFLSNNFALANDLNLNLRLRHHSETGHLTQISGSVTQLPPVTQADMRLSWKAGRQTEVSLLGRNLLKKDHTEFISSFPVSRAFNAQRSVMLQVVTRF